MVKVDIKWNTVKLYLFYTIALEASILIVTRLNSYLLKINKRTFAEEKSLTFILCDKDLCVGMLRLPNTKK